MAVDFADLEAHVGPVDAADRRRRKSSHRIDREEVTEQGGRRNEISWEKRTEVNKALTHSMVHEGQCVCCDQSLIK